MKSLKHYTTQISNLLSQIGITIIIGQKIKAYVLKTIYKKL